MSYAARLTRDARKRQAVTWIGSDPTPDELDTRFDALTLVLLEILRYTGDRDRYTVRQLIDAVEQLDVTSEVDATALEQLNASGTADHGYSNARRRLERLVADGAIRQTRGTDPDFVVYHR